MKNRILISFLLILFIPSLIAVKTFTQTADKAIITVESAEVRAGEKTTIKILASAVPSPGIASIQGKLSFNSAVLKINDVSFSPNFNPNLSVKNIQAGEVRFAATIKMEKDQTPQPITEGLLLELAVEAIGKEGDCSSLDLALEVLSDLEFAAIAYEIKPGTFCIIKKENIKPTADFTFSPRFPGVNQDVHFIDKSKDEDGQVVGWLWEFGDGTTSNIQTPSHRYRAVGSFTVKLTVTDNEGAKSTAVSKLITIIPAPPYIFNFPNPAKDKTTFYYILPEGTRQPKLLIFDILGRLVFHRDLDLTQNEFGWNLKSDAGEPLPNGPYFYFLTAIDRAGNVIRSKIEVLVIQRG